MIACELAVALGEGATLVTPNNRLARHLVTAYDTVQATAGRRAWVAGRAFAWQVWLTSLWNDALAAGAVTPPRELIPDRAAACLWDRIVAQESEGLLDARGAARLAAEAWRLFHAWRRPDDRFDGWSRSGIGDDAATFARWAQRYRSTLAQLDLVDPAQLADRLVDAAAKVSEFHPSTIVTVGFIRFTSQQQRLFDALRDAGVKVTHTGMPQVPLSRRLRVTCTTAEAELDHALAWARTRALADPAAAVGIVIDDLASRRADIAARADDILCPVLALRIAPDEPRPYDISLGAALAEVPLVTTALDLIALPAGGLPVDTAAALLRSPYLVDGDAQWLRRAGIERGWREQGTRTVALSDVLRALDATDSRLAERWRAALVPGRTAQSPAQWANDWRSWLHALGWPGQRAQGSGEWQASEAWSRLLAEFAALGTVAPVMSRDVALQTLRAMAAQTLFQPEGPAARIQILGVLEASGLTFDALWIAGMTAERWPPAPEANPLLPLAWQRERGVPHSEPAGDLLHATALTEGFAAAATEVVVSHAREADGQQRAGSALFAAWEERALATMPLPTGYAGAIAAQSHPFTPDADDLLEPLPLGTAVKGGAGVIESQSACPFQAFARHRLRAEAWPGANEGLTPMERGSLLHAAMAALWDDLRDHATLVALTLSQLDARIAVAVARARGELARTRWQALPAAVAAGESQRLHEIIRTWLDTVERVRPPFAVRDTEWALPLALGGLDLALRIDRVDTLADGGVAVIDYKSGRTVAAARWFAPRPSGTQVGLYALALRAAPEPPPVRAAVYAQLKAGAINVTGLTADADAWPTVKTASALHASPLPNWAAVEAFWERRYGELAADFRAGIAVVAPRDGQSCKRCGLQALCRIQSLDDLTRAAVIDAVE